MLMSKSEFAGHIGVTPGRISQMILSGMIAADALDGEGRKARIRVAVAMEQIRRKRDVGQSLANGLNTRLDVRLPIEAASGFQDDGDNSPPKIVTVDDELKQERLAAERRRNRIAAQDEAIKRGQLLDAVQVKSEMRKLAQMVDDENAGMLNDFASGIAAAFNVSQRDVLHLLRKIRSDKKGQAAARGRRLAESLPETSEVLIEEQVT